MNFYTDCRHKGTYSVHANVFCAFPHLSLIQFWGKCGPYVFRTGQMYFVFCRLYPFSPQPCTTAVFRSYLSSLYFYLTLYRRCGLAQSYDDRGFVGPQKEVDRGPLSIEFSVGVPLSGSHLLNWLPINACSWPPGSCFTLLQLQPANKIRLNLQASFSSSIASSRF